MSWLIFERSVAPSRPVVDSSTVPSWTRSPRASTTSIATTAVSASPAGAAPGPAAGAVVAAAAGCAPAGTAASDLLGLRPGSRVASAGCAAAAAPGGAGADRTSIATPIPTATTRIAARATIALDLRATRAAPTTASTTGTPLAGR